MERQFRCDETTTVKTTLGLLRGFLLDELYIFKGVPYAQAERFMPPKPLEPWEGIMDTTSFGYVCPLLHQEKPQGELLVPHRYWPMDEHCQNLNIWTPGLDDRKRPVLVWLHGGGFSAGSAIEHDAYEGENMSRLGDVVSVSINHRLNILGYFDLSPYGEKYRHSGNAGGDDIIASLQWIHDNIAAFGGDPENVTVFGQSGGGAKVTTLLQSPAADGLFHKGVVMSGVLNKLSGGSEAGDSRPIVQALLSELGLQEEEVEKLETMPYAQMAAAYERVAPALRAKGCYVGCMPKLDESYAGNPLTVGFRKEAGNVPLMVGNVFGEFAFAPLTYDKRTLTADEGRQIIRQRLGEELAEELLPVFEATYPQRNPVDLLCLDALFRQPAIAYAKKWTESQSAPLYAYLFDMDFVIENGKPAWHCSDIPYFFHNTEMVPAVNVSGVTKTLEQQMFDCLMSFARTGNPNHSGVPEWKPCSADHEPVMIFGSQCELRTDFDHAMQQKMTDAIINTIREASAKADIIH